MNTAVWLKPGPLTCAANLVTCAGSTTPEAVRTTAWTPLAQDVAALESAASEKNGDPEHAVTGQTSNDARVGAAGVPAPELLKPSIATRPVE